MKIRYPVIAIIIILIIEINFQMILPFEISETLDLMLLICLALFAYLIIRNIFRAIKGAVTGTPQGRDYQEEARRVCERVAPKPKKNATPPWEK